MNDSHYLGGYYAHSPFVGESSSTAYASTMQRALIVLVLALFAVLSGAALWYHGYWGIIAPTFRSFAAAQVFADLVISLALVMVWMWRDARAQGRNPWPWILATLVVGSFGPLVYLLSRREAVSSASEV